MTKISKFDKPTLTKFRKEFKDSIKELEAQYGVKIDLGNISYSAEQFTSKITTTIVGEGVNALNASALKDLDLYGYAFGISSKDFGRSFTSNGRTYTLCGIKPRSPKYPILGKRSDGKVYKFGVNVVSKLK